jgi:cytochrome b
MTQQVYVWDRFVRVFHWSLVLLFVTSYLSGEEEHWIHVYSGYTIIALVVMRVIWGFVGSRYARFANFAYSPRTVLSYIRSMVAGDPRRFLGHNPAAGAMVLALLAALSLTTLSGLKLYAVEEGKGPLAVDMRFEVVAQAHANGDREEHDEEEDDEEAEEFWEDLHETGVNALLLLILLHISGVAVSSRLHRESLAKAMITGEKDELIQS